MKKRAVFIMTFFLVIFFSQIVSAQVAPGKSPFGDIGLKPGIFKKILTWEIDMPAWAANRGGTINFWALVAIFALVFSVFYLASLKIPIFRDAESKGPVKAFAIALSFLVILSTNTVFYIGNLLFYGSSLLFSVLWIFLIGGMFLLLFRGAGHAAVSVGKTGELVGKGAESFGKGAKRWAVGGKLGAEAIKEAAESKRMSEDANRQIKDIKREKGAIKKIENLVDKELKDVGDLRKFLEEVKKNLAIIERITDAAQMQKSKELLMRQLASIMPLVEDEGTVINNLNGLLRDLEHTKTHREHLMGRMEAAKTSDLPEDRKNQLQNYFNQLETTERDLTEIENGLKDQLKKAQEANKNLREAATQTQLTIYRNDWPRAKVLVENMLYALRDAEGITEANARELETKSNAIGDLMIQIERFLANP